MKHRVTRGRILMLLSTFAFAAMALSAKSISPDVGSAQKVFFRSLTGLLLLPVFFLVSQTPMGRPSNRFGLLTRGFLGSVALLCYFYAIDTVGVVKATLYCYTYPIFATLFAWFDLGERPTAGVLVALAAAQIGVVLTLDLQHWNTTFTRGDLAGLAAGFFSGGAITSVRKLHQTETSVWIVLSFTAVASVLSFPFMTQHFVSPGGSLLAELLLLGLLATLAQMLMTYGYRYVTAMEGGVLSLMTVPISAILAMLILGETFPPRFWIGATIVFCAAVAATTQPPRTNHLKA